MIFSYDTNSLSCPRKRASIFIRSVVVCIVAPLSFIFFSCASTKPLPKFSKQSPKIPTAQQQLPDGWADITEKSKLPAIKKWFVNRDYSATIVLKELQSDDSTRKTLALEDICTAARISLQLKVGEFAGERRVTRIPERINGSSCSYVYEEKGLLRRVIVYKNGKGFFELELMQENQSVDFERLTTDQIGVLKVLSKDNLTPRR
ncbi:MAG: hypothetical protein HYV29_11510 [Ignavibacteriales bacterium]|nr:hypothetical protein [Ignavibacteriales bacterium]